MPGSLESSALNKSHVHAVPHKREAILTIPLIAVACGHLPGDWPAQTGQPAGGSHLNILLLLSTSTRGQQVEGRGWPNGSMSVLGKSSGQGGVPSNGGAQRGSSTEWKDESLSDQRFPISE